MMLTIYLILNPFYAHKIEVDHSKWMICLSLCLTWIVKLAKNLNQSPQLILIHNFLNPHTYMMEMKNEKSTFIPITAFRRALFFSCKMTAKIYLLRACVHRQYRIWLNKILNCFMNNVNHYLTCSQIRDKRLKAKSYMVKGPGSLSSDL